MRSALGLNPVGERWLFLKTDVPGDVQTIREDRIVPHRPTVTPPTGTVLELAGLLTSLDEFRRSSPAVAAELELFLTRQGHRYPEFAACNLIDKVSFTTLWLRSLISTLWLRSLISVRQARLRANPGR
jgi:hypothetical protein